MKESFDSNNSVLAESEKFSKEFVSSAKKDKDFDSEGGSFDLYNKSVDIYYSEFMNRDIINWKRARSVIEHENILINHRITWLVWSQAALLAASGVLMRMLFDRRTLAGNDPEQVSQGHNVYLLSATDILATLLALMLVGFFLAIAVYYNVQNANKQISRITKWWYREAFPNIYGEEENPGSNMEKWELVKKRDKFHPPLHVLRTTEKIREVKKIRLVARWFSQALKVENIPLSFAFCWVIIAFSSIAVRSRRLDGVAEWIDNYGAYVASGTVLGVFLALLIVVMIFKLVPR